MSETSRATAGPDAAEMRERSRLSFDLDVDICVVGAGLAGLTVALEAGMSAGTRPAINSARSCRATVFRSAS
jgi:hypothetical protein